MRHRVPEPWLRIPRQIPLVWVFALVGPIWWWGACFGQESVALPRPPRLVSDAEQRLFERLKEPALVDALECSLRDALHSVAEYQRISLRLDDPALEEVDCSSNLQVSLRMDGARLCRILQLLLEPFLLDVCIVGSDLVVRSHDDVRAHQNEWIYDVSDLLRSGIPAGELSAAIEACAERGKPPPKLRIVARVLESGELRVRQSLEARARLDRFLEQVRDAIQHDARPGRPKSLTHSRRYQIDELRNESAPGNAHFSDRISDEEFVRRLQSAIVAPSWRAVGGVGLMDLNAGRLIVRQDDATHAALAEYLEMLKGLHRDAPDMPITKEQFERVSSQLYNIHADLRATRAALHRQFSLRCDRLPLTEVCQKIRSVTGIQGHIYMPENSAGEFDRHSRVSLQADNERLSSIFDLVTEPLGIDWLIHETGHILICPRQYSSTVLETRAHDSGLRAHNSEAIAERISQIKSAIASETWKPASGPGVILPLGRLLVVVHNRRVQDDIEQWCAAAKLDSK